jgi:RHH-type proline utilization regulon transcriptional repressor/proline dehydrogenase/delta 1-pyrroline-5-carboxylate dehydrogenase
MGRLASSPSRHDTMLVDETVELVSRWLREAGAKQTRSERATVRTLGRLIDDPEGTAFTMRFVDRVARPDSNAVAAHQLASLVASHPLPPFLSRTDRLLLRAGAWLGPRLPETVIPLAMRRMRHLVGHLVVDAGAEALAAHLQQMQQQGFAQNVNLLGEAVLGQREDDRRLEATTAHDAQPHDDYVSNKVS